MKKNKLSRLNKILEMPSEITSQIPRVTNLGFKKMMIENYKNILEYQDFFYKNKYLYRYYQYKWIWYEDGGND